MLKVFLKEHLPYLTMLVLGVIIGVQQRPEARVQHDTHAVCTPVQQADVRLQVFKTMVLGCQRIQTSMLRTEPEKACMQIVTRMYKKGAE